MITSIVTFKLPPEMSREKWRYGADDLPDRFDQVVQSWDTANKPTQLSDYSVCTTWGNQG